MRRINLFLAFVSFLVVVGWPYVSAQVATGIQPFGSYGGGPDAVDLANLNVHLDVPIRTKAGRGLNFSYALGYDTSIWTSGSSNAWTPAYNFGWTAETQGQTGYVTATTNLWKCFSGSTWYWATTYARWIYYDRNGTPHPFSLPTISACSAFPSSASGSAGDGSGYQIKAYPGSAVLQDAGGHTFNPPYSVGTGSGTAEDTNGNEITFDGTTFKDTLGQPALSVSGTNPMTFSYTAPSGATAQYVVSYTSYTVRTHFGCGGISEYGPFSISLVNRITLPDSSYYQFSYEATPGYSGDVTGRLASVMLPTGGTIVYAYSGGSSGAITCADGSAATLTRTTPDGAWKYAHSESGSAWTTTITDPLNDSTTVYFQDVFTNTSTYFARSEYETQRLIHDNASNLLETVSTCYNGNTSNCNSTTVTMPISEIKGYLEWPTSQESETDTSYNTYGLPTLVKEYDYGNGTPGTLLRQTATSYASLGNDIQDRPATVTVEDGSGNPKALTTYTYDEGTPAATSTPQHLAITGSRGNLTTVAAQASSGGTTLYRHFTYYDTGMLNTSTDVSTSSTTNGATTTYTYGSASCGNSFVTSMSEPLSLSRSFGYDASCLGAVLISSTDENGQTSHSNYTTDPDFWRPNSIEDAAGNTTTFTYIGQNQVESAMLFNSSNSVTDQLITLDGLGRMIFAQTRQGPGSSNFDTVATCHDPDARTSFVSLPYSAGAASPSTSCPSASVKGTSYTYDALSRTASATDGGGGAVSYTYTGIDTLQQITPAPLGEHIKQKQFEYDGLGRMKSLCEVTSGTGAFPGGHCSPPQTTSQTGYLTTYTYDLLNDLTGVTQNAQGSPAQTRTYVYDMLGRLTSETNPEIANPTTLSLIPMTYAYDTFPSGCYNWGDNQAGNLTGKTDANGNTSCYHDDAMHRLADVGYSGPNSTSCRRFRYDITTNGVNGSAPSGVTVGNVKGRLMEAETDNCGAWPPTPITDDWFGYSTRGEVTDTYSSTPHSGGYKHLAETFWPNGTIDSVAVPGMPTLYYGAADGSGLDGEGRVKKVNASTGTNPVIGATYMTSGAPAGALTQVVYGSGDTDNFTFYSTTGRMQQYQLNMGSLSDTGTLTWNANGSLGTLGIVDQIGTANTQTCTFSHDDLSRIASANCGSAWSQTFTYDAFGNITKSGSMSWLPGYNANNRYTLGGTSYDANGNVLNDTAHIYTWDANGNLATADSAPVTYDALGRMAENGTSSYNQYLYLGDGQTQFAWINGSSTGGKAQMPGGGFAIFGGGSITQYNHPDWLGSARLITSPSRTILEDTSFAPYGEAYGGGSGGWMQFTPFSGEGTVWGPNNSGLDDFLFRRYSSTQSRWISPDPAGMGAVDPTNPQTWNRYAYVANNPLSAIDPLGLFPTVGTGGGEGGGGGGCDPDFGCDPGCDPDFGCDPNPCEQGCVAGGDSPSGPPAGPTPGPLRRNPNWSTETLGLPGGLHLQPLSLANLLGLSPGTECDFGVCAPIGDGFLPALAGGGTLICQIAEPCGAIEDGILITAAAVVGIAAIHQMAKKADIQFAHDVAKAVEKICGPGRVTTDQIHDLLHWGHYGSFNEAVQDIAAIVCPEKTGGQ